MQTIQKLSQQDLQKVCGGELRASTLFNNKTGKLFLGCMAVIDNEDGTTEALVIPAKLFWDLTNGVFDRRRTSMVNLAEEYNLLPDELDFVCRAFRASKHIN